MIEGPLPGPLAERLVETAVAAPSLHNSQPWRFVARLADRTIDLYADPARTMRRGDPRGRAVHIACGSALFNLRLAATHAGMEPVTRLLPDPRNPLLLASLRLAGPHRPRPDERDLHGEIRVGQSRPRPATGHRPPPRSVLAALAEAAVLEGACLRVCERKEALRILHAMVAADQALAAEPGYLSGLREPSSGPSRTLASEPFDGAAQLVVLTTRSDDRLSWLRVGQALQRVLLLAAHRGLEAVPLSPVLEVPDGPPRPDLRRADEYAEMILRLGRGPLTPPGPRRPVAQVMRVISPVPLRQDEGPRRPPPPALDPPPRELIPSR